MDVSSVAKIRPCSGKTDADPYRMRTLILFHQFLSYQPGWIVGMIAAGTSDHLRPVITLGPNPTRIMTLRSLLGLSRSYVRSLGATTLGTIDSVLLAFGFATLS